MGRSQESFNKKEVKNKKDKKRKDKEQKRLERKDSEKSGNFEDMIAYVDENGMITSTPPDPDKKKSVINHEDIEVSIPKKQDVVLDPIRKGSVSFFNESKGYGFIRDMETQESFFVHINNVLEPIKEGNLVNFEIENGQKGPAAVRVKLFKA
jgi:cold shock CspA family protein